MNFGTIFINKKVIRERYERLNFYGRTRQETVSNLIRESNIALYMNYWDEKDSTPRETFWQITKSLCPEHISKFSPRLQHLLNDWNSIKEGKRLVICHNHQQNLHFYIEGDEEGIEKKQSYKITGKEERKLLGIMINYDLHNSNGWLLNGSHRYDWDYPILYKNIIDDTVHRRCP